MTHRILILGGTGEARQLAGRLAGHADLAVSLSLAGRTAAPLAQPVPTRIGGFGGVAGLAEHLRRDAVDLLVDATHPHAARISANALTAAELTGVPLIRLRRAAWQPGDGDRWTVVRNVEQARSALGAAPRRVFLTLGRNEVAVFAAAPQHSYLVRSVDPIEPPLAVPDASYLLARGPFEMEAERDLLRAHGIEAIVAKNSGGEATYAKIAAARALGIEVVLIEAPSEPTPAVATVEAAVEAIGHQLASLTARGA